MILHATQGGMLYADNVQITSFRLQADSVKSIFCVHRVLGDMGHITIPGVDITQDAVYPPRDSYTP